ncbi:HHR118Wp [Eremothecium sinecaudum]|uniref:Phosphoserine aminotransferase n=1 Tax=Eremothecium sinecaudum TaxID=45286 RepID=A0A0X8HWS0_9SACH|nr:HHR118Wp [Eremothecium sinecaudum]AMD22887.1 HHR118Wp [Eremothecium sinecaudum]
MVLTREQPHFFGAGPAQLPTVVLQQAAADLIDYQGLGLGIGEISHRSKEAGKVIDDCKKHVKELLGVPETFEVFFMQGGGTTGFSSIASNLTAAKVGRDQKPGTAAYLVTGAWSEKAVQEAERLGISTEVIFNTKKASGDFVSIPATSEWVDKVTADKHSYVYLCENETVHGVEWPEVPLELAAKGVPVVADLSSNIFSREIDVNRYDLIMAGAQKNIGLAGLTIYIIRKTLLEDISKVPESQLRDMGVPIAPIASHYPTVVKNNSAYNTIPIFTLHIIDLVLQHLLKRGGLQSQQSVNEEKAKMLYEALDQHSDFYNLPVDKKVRSKMNVIFTLKKDGLNDKFVEEAAKLRLTGLKGHRSVGGFRASLYNAVDISSVRLLADFVVRFAQENAQ